MLSLSLICNYFTITVNHPNEIFQIENKSSGLFMYEGFWEFVEELQKYLYL